MRRYNTAMRGSINQLMRLALDVASNGKSIDLPIAAVITDWSGSIIGSSRNAVLEKGDATAHAELLAVGTVPLNTLKGDAGRMTIAVTLEPCPMCAWAIRSAGIGRLVFGAYNPQYGAAGSVYDLLRDKRRGSNVEVIGGVLEDECQRLMDDAFLNIRNNGLR